MLLGDARPRDWPTPRLRRDRFAVRRQRTHQQHRAPFSARAAHAEAPGPPSSPARRLGLPAAAPAPQASVLRQPPRCQAGRHHPRPRPPPSDRWGNPREGAPPPHGKAAGRHPSAAPLPRRAGLAPALTFSCPSSRKKGSSPPPLGPAAIRASSSPCRPVQRPWAAPREGEGGSRGLPGGCGGRWCRGMVDASSAIN